MRKNGLKLLLLSLTLLTLSACSGGKDDGGGGGGVPDPRACVLADVPHATQVSGSYYSADNNNCRALACDTANGWTVRVGGSDCTYTGTGGGPGGGGTPAPNTLFYSQSILTVSVGTVYTGQVPTVNNCDASSVCTYSVAPALPSGLSLNSSTGQITGSSSVISARRNYIITVSNSGGSTTATLSLASNPRAPQLTNPGNSLIFYQVNQSISGGTLASVTSGSGSVASITVSPALPAGISLHINNDGFGKIASVSLVGTPTVNTPDTTYTLTASAESSYGYSPFQTTFRLSTETMIAGFTYSFPALTSGVGCVYSGSDIQCVFQKGVQFNALTPIIGQGNNISYEIIPGAGFDSILPEGIGLSTGSGNISTTSVGPFDVTVCAGFCTYKIRASNNISFAERTVKILVENPSAPTGISYAGPFNWRKLQTPADVTPVFVPVDGRPACHGQGGCYTITPALNVLGINFSTAYGTIKVNPNIQETLVNTNFTITVKDTSLSASFSLSVDEAIPVFSYNNGGEFVVAKNGTAIIPIEINSLSIPTNHVTYNATPTSFFITPALPSGLALNTGTYMYNVTNTGGAISGNPTSIMPRTKYTITGCRGSGCSSVEIYITIRPNLTGVALGEKHSCVIEEGFVGIASSPADNKILCWGNNDRGQLGYASSEDCSGVACAKSAHYVRVDGANGSPLTGALEISAGKNHTCAIIDPSGSGRGKVYCWGDNSQQQIAPTAEGSLITAPRTIKRKLLARCAPTDTDCVNNVGDQTAGMDMNGASQLSLGKEDTCFQGIAEVNIGAAHSVPAGVSRYGHSTEIVHCLGRNYNSTIAANGQAAPVGLGSSLETTFFAAGVSVGDNHACINYLSRSFNSAEANGTQGVDDDNDGEVDNLSKVVRGRIACWGANDVGQLGSGSMGSSTFSANPSIVTLGGSNYLTGVDQRVVAGGNHSCAVSSVQDEVYCWGSGSAGQLAKNSLVNSSVANTLFNYTLTSGIAKSESIFLTRDTTYVVDNKTNSALYYAGSLPLLGAPYSGSSSMILSPVKLTAADTFIAREMAFNYVHASQASGYMCAEGSLMYGGVLQCWGNNDRGQLGDSTDTNSVLPVKVNFVGN